MTTLAELNKFVRDTINTVTPMGHNAISHNPNAPRPKGDYATVHIGPLTKVGTIDKKMVNNGPQDLDEIVVMLYDAMVSVNYYRGDAQQNAAMLTGAMRRQSVIDNFNANGLGFVRPSEVRELTQLQDQGHEERAQVDLFIQFELTPIQEVITGVDSVKVVGDVDNSQEVVESVDITTGL